MSNDLKNSSNNNIGEDSRKTAEQRIVILVVVITAFVTTFTGSALNLSIPDIGEQFHVSANFVGWLVTGYTLAVAAFSVPIGRLADITCRKTVLVTGLVIFTACCIAAVFAVSMTMLLVVRVIQGIGAAMIFSTNTAILIASFPRQMRGRVLGYSIASTYTGLSAGPVIGGALNHNLGWKSTFILTGVLAAVALIASTKLAKIRDDQKENIAAVMVKLFEENMGFVFSNLSALLNYSATFAISYLISIYLQVVMGYSSQTAGLIMICQPAIMAVLSPVMGRLSDKFSPFKMSSIGMGFCAAGAAIFIFIGSDSDLAMIIVALVVTGIGFSLFSSPNTNAVMSCVDKTEYGVASSILATMRSIGHTLSMVIVTIIVTRFMGDAPLASADPQVLVKVINTSFVVFTAICIVGVFVSLKRK